MAFTTASATTAVGTRVALSFVGTSSSAPSSAQPQQPLGFSRPPAHKFFHNAFRMFRQASSKPLAPIGPSQPQTISRLFITCSDATIVTNWLCRLWQAMTGYLPVVSVASLLAADTPSEQLPSDALLQTWHRLRLAVLHSIWTASQTAQASRPTQPSDASEPDANLTSSPTTQQASLSSLSSTSHHGHSARQLTLKTVKAMIHNDWIKCNDNMKQISGVCSSWLGGKDPSMLSRAFGAITVFWHLSICSLEIDKLCFELVNS